MKPLQDILRHINIAWVLLAWLLVTIGIALNRGIDLLWGMAALLACALAAGWLLPWLQLRGISVQRRLPAEATAGHPLSLEYDIAVRGGLPRYGVELLDALGAEGQLALAACVHKLAGQQRLRLSWAPPVRGLRQFGEVALESRFPLGLTLARRRIPLEPQPLLVYPAAVPLRGLLIENGAETHSTLVLSNRRGGNDEFFGLRPYRHGDPVRAVHWRASARLGTLLSREYEHQQDRWLWIVLDLSAQHHAGEGAAGSAEMMFKLAHSVALRARAEAVPVGLLYRDADGVQRLNPALDQVSYLQLRDRLARAALGDLPSPDVWLASEAERLPRGGNWLVFNLAGAQRRAALAALCRRRQAQPQLIEFDPNSFRPWATVATAPVQRRYDGVPVWTLDCGADLGALFA